MTPEQHELEVLIKSRYPIIVVETEEEARFCDLIAGLAQLNEWALFEWRVTDGLQRKTNVFDRAEARTLDSYDLEHALRHLYKSPQNGVFVFLDAHPFLDDPVTIRLVKNIVQYVQHTQRCLIFVSPQLQLPQELQRYATSFSLAMPTLKELRALLMEEADAWTRIRGGEKVRADPEAVNQMLRLLLGLTQDDARRLIRQAIEDDGAITQPDLLLVQKTKNRLLNQDELLSLETQTAQYAEVGGLARLKAWLALRKPAFMGEVQGLEPPKGLMLTGVQGCGKSLAAKCVAGSWSLPLLRLDFGVLYNKYFGETERNLRRALQAAERMAPCVLWMDEIEKALSRSEDGMDGGVSHRVLGTILTWMAERKCMVFVVATCNELDRLPPELVRKGRFDEIFFIDLPAAASREEVFRIHLHRRQLDAQAFDLPALAAASAGFSGAEIEQAVVAGLYSAHGAQTTLDQARLVQELHQTQPLSVVMAEHLESLRDWSRGRTVSAE